MLLPAWVAALATGIAAAVVCPGRVAAALALVLGMVGTWRARRGHPASAVVALLAASGILMGLRALPPPLTPLDDRAPVDEAIEANIVRGPERADAAGTRARLWLDLVARGGQPASGAVLLSVGGDAAALSARFGPGDRIAFRAALHVPIGLANPGLPDARLQARAQGIDRYASLASSEQLRRLERGSAWSPRRIAWRLRGALADAINAQVPPPARDLLLTVVLGVRAGVGDEVEDGFRAAGATHVLSVSGLHLAAVAALIFFLVRWAAAAWPALALRVGAARIAAAVALPAVLLYTLLTGEAVATVRSALMAGAALGAVLAGRSFSLASSIALAALVLLVRAPLALLDVSFQLSFASVMALGLFARRLAPESPRGGRWRRITGWLGRFAAATVAAGLTTAPLVAHHFNEVTPAAPLGNLALVPLVELVLLPLGLGGAVLGAIHPMAGALPLWVAGGAARLALWVAELFRGFAPVLLVRTPNPLETATLLLAASAVLAALGRPRGARRRWWWCAGVALTLAVASLSGRALARRYDPDTRVTFLDVGQGDAAVVEGPGGFVAVVDGGGSYDGEFDTGARVVEPFLRARGISRLDLVVLSHPHPDHMNGLFRLLGRFPVSALWTSGDGRNPRYGELLALARSRAVPTPAPVPLEVRGLRLQPLGPWVRDAIGVAEGNGINDNSLVMRLSHAGRAVLFAGDLEADGEAELVGNAAAGLPIGAEVLKVPHHGSGTSSSDELLDAVMPSLAVISLGRHNRFRFPRPEVLARYGARGTRVLRTDRVGAVTIGIDPGGRLSIRCVRGC